jgi:hypothetical protein
LAPEDSAVAAPGALALAAAAAAGATVTASIPSAGGSAGWNEPAADGAAGCVARCVTGREAARASGSAAGADGEETDSGLAVVEGSVAAGAVCGARGRAGDETGQRDEPDPRVEAEPAAERALARGIEPESADNAARAARGEACGGADAGRGVGCGKGKEMGTDRSVGGGVVAGAAWTAFAESADE